jgi:periplasmic protein CpxP/Spy
MKSGSRLLARLGGTLSLAITVAAVQPALAMPGGHDMGGMRGMGGMHAMHTMGGGHGGHGEGGPMMDGMPMRLLDNINATPEQRTQIQQIVQANAAEMRTLREDSRALRAQAMALFAQPTVDANAVEALRQKQLAQHDVMSKRMTATMLEVSRVLTPEQRRQMAEQMTQRREMMQRHQRERQSLHRHGS